MSSPPTPSRTTEPEIELQPEKHRPLLANLLVVLLMVGLAYLLGLVLQTFFRWLGIAI